MLIAVDDYNVLYSHTGYQEAVHAFHRRDVTPDELRLVRVPRTWYCCWWYCWHCWYCWWCCAIQLMAVASTIII